MRKSLRHFALVVAALAFVGCSGAQETRTVTVPAQPSTARSTTDTLQLPALPPVPEPGIPTQPIEVQISRDTLPGPELQVKRLTVDRRTDDPGVTLQYESGGRTLTDRYDLPAFGEALDIYPEQESRRYGERRARSDTARDTVIVPGAQLRGETQARQVEARVEEEPSLWDRVTGRLAWLGGLVLLGAGLYALHTFTSILPWS